MVDRYHYVKLFVIQHLILHTCYIKRQGNSLETIRNMVASNLGITVLPCSATAERYNNPLIKVIPFTHPAPTRRIAIAWRKSFVRVEAVEKIADAVSAIGSKYMKAVKITSVQVV